MKHTYGQCMAQFWKEGERLRKIREAQDTARYLRLTAERDAKVAEGLITEAHAAKVRDERLAAGA